ncbi:MAG: CCA tRNA nucleotidyltransferase [Planctomycetes bacterium]|nr:CCA tRNA nucleotidyltransferase [Planctomycetota bacterium]
MADASHRSESSVGARQAAQEIAKKFLDAGHIAYFAGGCVRDELLKLSPADYDIATSATTEDIQRIFPKARGVGESFGVILVHHKGRVIEVASFRSDGRYLDGRRPEAVALGDERSDAMRRDFTINGLFMHPLSGEVVDHVKGRADIDSRTLRAINDPDARLSEDRLRLLRAARFAARYQLTIEPETEAAIRAHARELRGVSRERVGQELRRMLSHPSRVAAVELIESLGLAPSTLLEAAPQSPLRRVRALSADAGQAAVLAAWLLDRESALPWQERVEQWTKALVLSNKERDALAGALSIRSSLSGWPGLTKALQKRTAANPAFPDALEVYATEAAGPAAAIRRDFQMLEKEGISPIPLLSGDDLIKLGLRAGPEFRRILDAVYDEQLEGRIDSARAAIDLARQLSRP